MGTSSSSPAPQVRERHVRALYINVPVDPSVLQRWVHSPVELDLHAGRAWVSIVVDDLFKLETPISRNKFIHVPGMNGIIVQGIHACVHTLINNDKNKTKNVLFANCFAHALACFLVTLLWHLKI